MAMLGVNDGILGAFTAEGVSFIRAALRVTLRTRLQVEGVAIEI